MSIETPQAPRRRYRKRRRAELEEETRRRITEAAVELHGSVGPAKTTITGVAQLAGVQRATVYRHFPDEEALFGACSAHWLMENPLPDLASWEEIRDPAERLRTALAQLYAWYEGGEEMMENVTRDAPIVPAMRAQMEGMAAWLEIAASTQLRGRRERGARRRRVEAAIAHALAFSTWRSLVRERGLSNSEAAALMDGLVAAAAAG
jgi:AcrR family transcriptional regulator